MKKLLSLLLALTMLLSLCACAKTESSGETANASTQEPASAQESTASDVEPSTLVYGSGDYTRINPAMDEHGEINLLLFDGLTAHDGENNVVPASPKAGILTKEPTPTPSICAQMSPGTTASASPQTT